jgi:hypothetical protein
VLLGSLLNLEAVVAAARERGEDVAILCAGYRRVRAGRCLLRRRIVQLLDGERTDAAVAAEAIAAGYPTALDGLERPHLWTAGLEEDIAFCARESVLAAVPRFAGMQGAAAEIVLCASAIRVVVEPRTRHGDQNSGCDRKPSDSPRVLERLGLQPDMLARDRRSAVASSARQFSASGGTTLSRHRRRRRCRRRRRAGARSRRRSPSRAMATCCDCSKERRSASGDRPLSKSSATRSAFTLVQSMPSSELSIRTATA